MGSTDGIGAAAYITNGQTCPRALIIRGNRGVDPLEPQTLNATFLLEAPPAARFTERASDRCTPEGGSAPRSDGELPERRLRVSRTVAERID